MCAACLALIFFLFTLGVTVFVETGLPIKALAPALISAAATATFLLIHQRLELSLEILDSEDVA